MSVVLGKTWPALVVAEGVETVSVASYWTSSDASSAERAGALVEREWKTLLPNRYGHGAPEKGDKVVNES